jgi:hypothetical protein
MSLNVQQKFIEKLRQAIEAYDGALLLLETVFKRSGFVML